MPKLSLTDRAVANAKPGDLFDTLTHGLNLRTAESGVQTWFLVYSAPNGKRARLKLGRYPDTSLSRAREKALEARSHLEQGIDPRDHHRAEGAMTVAVLVESYLSKYVRPTLRSSKAVERRLTKNVVPVIGNTKLNELHRRDIIRVTDELVERGAPIESVKVFKDCRAMVRWAVERGVLDANPMDGMKPPAKENVSDRVLSDDEIATIWRSTALAKPAHRAIIKLCLLTGQRVGEVASMTADEIDLKARTWTIPVERSKNKNRHVVQLSDAAIAIIKTATGDMQNTLAERGRIFLDVGDTSAIGKCIHRADFGIAHFTAHDLRRTAVTGMAELGVSPIVLGHVINHRSVTKAGVTLAVYSHYDYQREKREALELWADRLDAIIKGIDCKIIHMTPHVAT